VCPITVRSPCNLTLRGFSWERGISSFRLLRGLVPCLEVDPPDLPKGSLYTLHRDVQHPACLTFSVPPIALHSGSGLLTRFPSATAFALTLGADSPCADERCAGNLGLSASMPFTCFIATHVSIRTSDTSSELDNPPSQAYGTLSYHARNPLSMLVTIRLDFNIRFGLGRDLKSLNIARPSAVQVSLVQASYARTYSGGLRTSASSVIGLQPRYIFRAGRLDQ
jgi:hypothetical protein